MTVLAFLLPVLVLFVGFRFVPMLGAVGLSLTDYQLGGDWRFVGTANYRRLFQDEVFLGSLRTTLCYVATSVPLTVFFGICTALMLNAVRWGHGLFRAALFAPYVTSLTLTGVVWRWVYEPEGPLNGLLAAVGSGPVGFLERTSLVLPSLALVSAWKGFGYSMVILLAGIRNIPSDCLEAARVDGATRWQRFRHVTLPFLRPTLFFVVVIETIGAFQVFDTIYVMTGGGPVRASHTLAYAVYDYAFRYFEVSYAATAGVVLWAIVLLVSIAQRRVFGRSP